jgi:sucrose-phosphate synthase
MAAGNEWINGYLEAILDAGSKLRPQGVQLPPLEPAPALAAEESGAGYNPTRYFVEEVVRSFDEQALHKTWTKVTVYRSAMPARSSLIGCSHQSINLRRSWFMIDWLVTTG